MKGMDRVDDKVIKSREDKNSEPKLFHFFQVPWLELSSCPLLAWLFHDDSFITTFHVKKCQTVMPSKSESEWEHVFNFRGFAAPLPLRSVTLGFFFRSCFCFWFLLRFVLSCLLRTKYFSEVTSRQPEEGMNSGGHLYQVKLYWTHLQHITFNSLQERRQVVRVGVEQEIFLPLLQLHCTLTTAWMTSQELERRVSFLFTHIFLQKNTTYPFLPQVMGITWAKARCQ